MIKIQLVVAIIFIITSISFGVENKIISGTIYDALTNETISDVNIYISKQKIGTIITSETLKETKLHFEIWKGKETQNPVKWLYKAN